MTADLFSNRRNGVINVASPSRLRNGGLVGLARRG